MAETERAETRSVGAVTLWSLRHCQAEYMREREREILKFDLCERESDSEI